MTGGFVRDHRSVEMKKKREDHMETRKDSPRGSAVNKGLSPALNAQTALGDQGRSVTPTVVAWAFETKDMLGLGANCRHLQSLAKTKT